MRTKILIGSALFAALAGCGLENFFGNVGRSARERPASTIRGALAVPGATEAQFTVLDQKGDVLADANAPFQVSLKSGEYEVRLPSSDYQMIRNEARAGNILLRAIVPQLGKESAVGGVDLDAQLMTEALIVEARLSKEGIDFVQTSPDAFLGDGVTSGTRTLIRKAFDVSGPAQTLLQMVVRLLANGDPQSASSNPAFFNVPVLDASYNVTTSALDATWLANSRIDYDGDGVPDLDSSKFDAQLAAAAKVYDPRGCPDPTHLRLVFTVDFNAGSLDGTCLTVNRFKWVVDKPGKQMFFVGWVHQDSIGLDSQTFAEVNAMLGAGVPNTIPMYDDGTHGDEAAGDGIWTVAFVVPYDPSRTLRVGYKYTWGTQGAVWTGSEEWPGNSRILQVQDVNGDGFVYRRDVFSDESTNKDRANLNPAIGGTLGWDEGVHGCGPEAREQPFTLHSACQCGTSWFVPKAIGPVRVACTQ